MKRFRQLALGAVFGAAMAALGAGAARADGGGRPGTIVWSDGRKISGALSMSPGKQLRIFTADGEPYMVRLDEVREMRFTPKNEEMWKGFYFATAGQATKTYTGEVYPIREIDAEITLSNGMVLQGHLFATTLYAETDDATEKIVLVAKQTGANGQKLADLPYPTDIRFDAGAPSAGMSRIDLTQAGLKDIQPPVVVARPDLAPLPAQQQGEGKPVWTVPLGNPAMILFAVQAADGIHVSWPADASPGPGADSAVRQAAQGGVDAMQDFYDTRTLLGCFAEADDAYAVVMMKRLGDTAAMNGTEYPWSAAVLHFKYDSAQKKMTSLLNRVTLAVGQTSRSAQPPAVILEPGYLRDITAAPVPAPTPEGARP